MSRKAKAAEVTAEALAFRIQQGTATLFGMAGHLADQERVGRNARNDGMFSFTVYADGNYAVITVPVYPEV